MQGSHLMNWQQNIRMEVYSVFSQQLIILRQQQPAQNALHSHNLGSCASSRECKCHSQGRSAACILGKKHGDRVYFLCQKNIIEKKRLETLSRERIYYTTKIEKNGWMVFILVKNPIVSLKHRFLTFLVLKEISNPHRNHNSKITRGKTLTQFATKWLTLEENASPLNMCNHFFI